MHNDYTFIVVSWSTFQEPVSESGGCLAVHEKTGEEDLSLKKTKNLIFRGLLSLLSYTPLLCDLWSGRQEIIFSVSWVNPVLVYLPVMLGSPLHLLTTLWSEEQLS